MVFKFRFSLLNIYIWNVIAIIFFCIKFLPEFLDVAFMYRILIMVAVLTIYFVSINIKFFRHIVCILASFLWSFLIAQTADYYFGISSNIRTLIYISLTVIFYIWHLFFTENPFNIVSAVAIEAPTEFSSDVQYIPKYIPFTDSSKLSTDITQYFNNRNNAIKDLRNEFVNKVSDVSNNTEILNRYEKLINNFSDSINKIIIEYNSKCLTVDNAKEQIDQLCDQVLLSIQELIDKV